MMDTLHRIVCMQLLSNFETPAVAPLKISGSAVEIAEGYGLCSSQQIQLEKWRPIKWIMLNNTQQKTLHVVKKD